MRFDLADRTALVTGSSRGIGLAIAEMLYREGCRVALNGRNADALMSVAARLPSAVVVAGDVTYPDEARRIITEAIAVFGRLDILVCNVGSGRSVRPGEETYNEWQRVFALNLWSTTNVVEAAHEALKASRGVIVCVSSICGVEVVSGAPVTYSAAKAALNAYVRGIARPLGRMGIRINAVALGNVLFDGSVWSTKVAEDADAVREMLEHEVALARLGSLQEVAELVAYLASPRAQFATGGIWVLDGGQIRS